jgi:DNA-binding NtrC family response regulator
VRELENVISPVVILTDKSFIDPSHFPAYIKNPKGEAPHESSLDGVIRKHIGIVLEECHGNRSHASRKLGISRRALLRKIEEYSIK